ncbi:unnamed protein product, partial [marine sediment metagenome]
DKNQGNYRQNQTKSLSAGFPAYNNQQDTNNYI